MSHVFHRHSAEATGAAQATPELVVTVYPASVATSSDPDDPIQAQLRLTIMNASSNSVTLDPPGTSDDKLIVYFPWGDGPGDLTAQPTTIDVEPPPGWQATQATTSGIGVYWQLSPDATTTLDQHDAVAFLFTGIVAQGPASATTLYLESTIGGVQGPQIAVPLPKETPLRIRSFTATPSKVLPGQNVTLAWATDGAVSGTIDPGNIAADSSPGTTQAPVTAATTFTLTATAIDGSSVASNAAVDVYPAEGGWVTWGSGLQSQQGSGVTMLGQLTGSYVSVVSTNTLSSYWTTAYWSRECQQWEKLELSSDPAQQLAHDGMTWTASAGQLLVLQLFGLSWNWNGLYTTTDGTTWNGPLGNPVQTKIGAIVVYANEVYLLGVLNGSAATWRLDGSDWTSVDKTAKWDTCTSLAAAVFDEQIWLFGIDGTGSAHCWSWEGGDADWVPRQPTTPDNTQPKQPLICGADDGLHAFVVVGTADQAWSHLIYADDRWSEAGETPPFDPSDGIWPGLAQYEGHLIAVGTKTWIYTG